MNEQLYMEIDLRKIKSNIETIKAISKKDIIPVIKSKAYSLGDVEIAKYLQSIGIKYIAVVDIIEAIRLLENNISIEILILNSLKIEDYVYLNRFSNLVVTINNYQDAESLNNFSFQRKLKVHFQIDTGMNRLGFQSYDDYKKALDILLKNNNITVEGIYTHFTDPKNRITQEERFIKYLSEYNFSMVHCAASSTYRESQIGNYVRVGLDVYGTQNKDNIKQCLKVACKILAVHFLKKGETIGYDRDYIAQSDMYVAVAPIGYFNGFRRSLRGIEVIINHKRYQTVGIVCMNHLFVKVDETITANDEIVILNEELTVSEMALYLKTTPHEIFCMMNIDDKRYLK